MSHTSRRSTGYGPCQRHGTESQYTIATPKAARTALMGLQKVMLLAAFPAKSSPTGLLDGKVVTSDPESPRSLKIAPIPLILNCLQKRPTPPKGA